MDKLTIKLNKSDVANIKKEDAELNFWSKLFDTKGFHNTWYKYFYTEAFGITEGEYVGKRLLDIGCGPCGSLEWIADRAKCFGLDPLCNEYWKKFMCHQHKMNYIYSKAESIPFPDEYFDYVFSFNSLDHVENVEKSCLEIARVLTPGGKFLLYVDINHEPTVCEPHSLSIDVIKTVPLNCESFNLYGRKYHDNGYKDVREKTPPDIVPKILTAIFSKTLTIENTK